MIFSDDNKPKQSLIIVRRAIALRIVACVGKIRLDVSGKSLVDVIINLCIRLIDHYALLQMSLN